MSRSAAFRTSGPWRLLRAAGVAAGVAVPVAALAYVVHSRFQPVLGTDEALLDAATGYTREGPVFLRVLVMWQELSQPRWVYLAAALVCLWVWRRRRLTLRPAWAFVTLMGCWSVAFGLKQLVQRARPVDEALTTASGYSFPSGHAMNSAAAATALLVLMWPLLRTTGRCAAVGAAVAFVGATAAGRVLLGVHYPSDVVAGVLVGAGMVLVSYAGYRRRTSSPSGGARRADSGREAARPPTQG